MRLTHYHCLSSEGEESALSFSLSLSHPNCLGVLESSIHRQWNRLECNSHKTLQSVHHFGICHSVRHLIIHLRHWSVSCNSFLSLLFCLCVICSKYELLCHMMLLIFCLKYNASLINIFSFHVTTANPSPSISRPAHFYLFPFVRSFSRHLSAGRRISLAASRFHSFL